MYKINIIDQKIVDLLMEDGRTQVACSIGEADVNVQLLARNTAEVYRFVTDGIGRAPGVRKTTTAIVPLVIKDVSQWRIPWLLLDDNRTQNTSWPGPGHLRRQLHVNKSR